MTKPFLSPATIENTQELVEMNEQLVIDEQYDVILSKDELTARMKDFILGTTYKCYLVMRDDTCCGYCLVDITRKPLYLRHLFIKSKYRRMGIGKEVVEQLMKLSGSTSLDIEVMAWNKNAIAFYEKLGFTCRFFGMRLRNTPKK
jgi:ribosomal protein S18 acetylase RimI-like enzyme